ncbi:MAG: glycosyltransferase family 4 protein [Candidatus Verstraetearchaeota archaeon]|nr:glycosyltransferase family 4 protein [Candidatus Verstraetearchaeota archaeon]
MTLINLRDKNLLIITPNFFTPIKEEILAIRNHFYSIYVAIPQPFFPKNLLNIQSIREKYLWISYAYSDITEFHNTNVRFYYPKSLILPLNFVKKRAPEFFSKSLLQKVSKSNLKVNLIHAHRLDYGYIGARLKERYNIPLIITTHGSDVYDFPFKGRYEYFVTKYALKHADHIIAISNREAKTLLSLGYSIDKISVIPNPVDTRLFRPLPQNKCRSLLNLPSNKKILLTVGNLTKVKGHIYLLEAMASITSKEEDVLLVIVGSGPLKNFLLKEIDKLKLKQKVLMVGEKTHKEIPLWLNASDIFILPSIDEGVPSSILEAIACGKPVIASNVGGIPDIISTNEIGFLIPPRNPKALSNAIMEALDKHWNSETIRKHAMQYSIENIANQIIELYFKILKS